jgi:ribosome-binding protein aMBF1 (putative translation factor)
LRQEFHQARPVGYLSRLLAESRAHAARIAAAAELQRSVDTLLTRAQTEEWSQRELARRAGIPETTLRRLRHGKADPLTWLPRIHPALARLTQA